MAEFAFSALPSASTTSTFHPAAFATLVAEAMTAALFASFAVIETIPSNLFTVAGPSPAPPAPPAAELHPAVPNIVAATNAVARTTLFLRIRVSPDWFNLCDKG
jgi:hypothetical protein